MSNAPSIQFRLKGYDYSKKGVYFITIRTEKMIYFFGKITNSKMLYTRIGIIARKFWLEIPKHFPFIVLDKFQIMPNHIHGILISTCSISNQNQMRESALRRDLAQDLLIKDSEIQIHSKCTNKFGPQSKNLASVIRGYKAAVAKRAKVNNILFKWHPRYYDRIIRSEEELFRIREYIENNVAQWDADKNHKPSQS